MICTRNANQMANIFLVTWVVCLDELMSIWQNQWTCPRWVFCSDKPHHFGNKYHTVCCGLSGIMFSMEIVEGKGCPCRIPEKWELRRMMGLVLRMLSSYFMMGRNVLLD